jgi:hypothetical protein
MKLKCKLEAIEDISTNNIEYSYSVSSDNCAFAEILHNELSGLKEPLTKSKITQMIESVLKSYDYKVKSLEFIGWANWLNNDELVSEFTCIID